MPTFQYTAKDSTGHTRTGVLEAETNSVAVAQLREQGLWVTQLHASGVKSPPSASGGARGGLIDPIWTGVSLRDMGFFFRQFATLVDAGMSLSQSLSTLSRQTANARLRRTVDDLGTQVQRGTQLSVAMARHPWIFTPMQVRMIEAAEAGGLMDRMMVRIADYLEREYEIRQKIKQRTLYPKLVMLAALFIPQLPILVLQGLVPYLRATVFGLLPVAAAVLVIWAVFRFLLQWPAFRYGYDTVKLNLPVVGGLIRKQITGRFVRGLAALYGAGVPVGRAMSWAAEACGNPRVADMVLRQVPRVERGESLTAALMATGFFSPAALGMMATGEQSGNVDGILTKLADYQEAEADHATRQMVTIGSTLFYLAVCIYVGYMVISSYAGYAGRIGGIGE